MYHRFFTIPSFNYQTTWIHVSCFGTTMRGIVDTTTHCLSSSKIFEGFPGTGVLHTNFVWGCQQLTVRAVRHKTCPILLAMDTFSSHTTGEQFRVMVRASWKFSSVIYLITCRRYIYICGWTGEPFNWRINGHHTDIMHRTTEDSHTTTHFNDDSHSQADMTVRAIDQVYNHDPFLCRIRESRWFRTLTTSSLLGMNLRVDCLWSLPALPIDHCELLGQLIINYINNAMIFSVSPGGQ